MKDNGERLALDRDLVAKHYPHLRYEFDEQRSVRLRGPLFFESDSGIKTRIGVRIEFPDSYPEIEPTAYHDENRFAQDQDQDRHILHDGRCCLWLPPLSRWEPHNEDALLRFLDEVALFFDRQLVYEVTGKWPGGQYPHGAAGYLEFIKETLVVGDVQLAALAPALLNRARLERKDPCPCGSGRKFKRCHALGIWQVQKKVSSELLASILF